MRNVVSKGPPTPLKTRIRRKHLVVLLALLNSISALAETQATSVDGTIQANKGCVEKTWVIEGTSSAANPQPADPYEAMKRKKSTGKESTVTKIMHSNSRYRKSGSPQPADVRRVFIDDFERLHKTVTKSQQRQTLWLRKKSKAD